MTHYSPKKSTEIPSVHQYVRRVRYGIQGTRAITHHKPTDVKKLDVPIKYADSAVPSIAYEQAHGQAYRVDDK